jgi:hypothetical protein
MAARLHVLNIVSGWEDFLDEEKDATETNMTLLTLVYRCRCVGVDTLLEWAGKRFTERVQAIDQSTTTTPDVGEWLLLFHEYNDHEPLDYSDRTIQWVQDMVRIRW